MSSPVVSAMSAQPVAQASQMLDGNIGWFFLGVFVLLIIASSIAYLLQYRWHQKHGHISNTLTNLTERINAWWVMASILLLTYLFNQTGVMVLFILISFFALREFLSLVYSRRGDHTALVLSFYVLLPAQYYLIGIEWYGLFSIFIPVYGVIALAVVSTLSGDAKFFLERVSKIQWAVLITVFFLSHVPALMTLKIEGFEGKNILLLVFLITVVQASDVCQYIWGKLAGHKKILPSISPSKTVAGTVGGIASATLLATGLWWLTPFTPLQAAGIGLLICLLGFVGGLVMSAIKRDSGVKDWGNIIQGHGGMMDRVDSICFAAPIYFHVIRYFWT